MFKTILNAGSTRDKTAPPEAAAESGHFGLGHPGVPRVRERIEGTYGVSAAAEDTTSEDTNDSG